MKRISSRVIDLALSLLAAAVLLSVSWSIIRPLIGPLLIVAGLCFVVPVAVRRYRGY